MKILIPEANHIIGQKYNLKFLNYLYHLQLYINNKYYIAFKMSPIIFK